MSNGERSSNRRQRSASGDELNSVAISASDKTTIGGKSASEARCVQQFEDASKRRTLTIVGNSSMVVYIRPQLNMSKYRGGYISVIRSRETLEAGFLTSV